MASQYRTIPTQRSQGGQGDSELDNIGPGFPEGVSPSDIDIILNETLGMAATPSVKLEDAKEANELILKKYGTRPVKEIVEKRNRNGSKFFKVIGYNDFVYDSRKRHLPLRMCYQMLHFLRAKGIVDPNDFFGE